MSGEEAFPPNSLDNSRRDEDASPPSPSQPSKARKLPRSCDFCRHRKIRCDGHNRPDGCFNCLAFGSPCTYIRPNKKRGPKNRLVEELRQKNAALEAQLRSLSVCSLCAQPLKSQPDQEASTSASIFQDSSSDGNNSDIVEPAHAEDDFAHVGLADHFRTLRIKAQALDDKFFGSSSSFVLVSNAIVAKEKYLGRPAPQHSRNPLYWEVLPWEKEIYDQEPKYVYPPSNLIASLLDLYFKNVYPILPVVHRPTFERHVAEGLHLKNTQFGAMLLAVLGVASRYSNDPRVFVDGDVSLSAGWKFVKQVQIVRKSFIPTLHDVQFYCLMTLFSVGTSAPQASWLYLGLGIRSIQQRGEHRRKRKERIFDAEEEQWNRAFWSVFYLDRMVCLFLGRPAGIHPEDYDVDLPLEVDDEYWDQGFVQPPGKPSVFSFFVCHVRLCEILGDALCQLYASKKAKVLRGSSRPEWEQRIVAELDSAMNNWFNTVPPHLHWDPDRTPDVFFDQSAVLYTTYHYIQIAIHRQYIFKATTSASASLSICTSAARSALHIANVWITKAERLPPEPFPMNSVFVSGIILLLNLFTTKRAGLSPEKNRDMEEVGMAMEFLKFTASRWQPAGRLLELLQELKSLDGPLSVKWAAKNERQPAGASASKSEPTMVSRETPPAFNQSAFDELYPTHELSFESDLWNGTVPSNGSYNDPETGIILQQLLADTAEFDSVNLSTENGSSGFANSIFDDSELASLWTAAPTNLASIGSWNAYLETGMMVDYSGTLDPPTS
ncbi:fungal-specific transcription factor domain-containing protein [Mycena rosella]|uniref:Fungal-specific transcription factor domain-containing protein n=1 Tax=Mycena rosella TaxID=1033263 RepID=A0AAD7DPD0_MYCRO|nr:fungal-specific transcription factor domain-containing protein [Mycena rosella]